MLAAIYTRLGDSGVLEVREVERPEPAAGEVRVRLSVSGVNPTDWKARAGLSVATGPKWAQVPNQDGAGTIDAVGPGVDRGRIGERVWVYFASWQRPWGTAAQWTVLPSDRAVTLPDAIDFDLGASLGIPALTAHRCLFADGPLEGLTVLVAGGAGAVGRASIELARWAGARVVATVSSEEKAVLALEAGASEVVEYREPDAAERVRAAAPRGVDRVVEVALRENLALDLEVCAPGAVVTTYADDGRGDVSIPVRRLMSPSLTLKFLLIYTVPATALVAAVEGVSQALVSGALSTLPIERFTLDHTAAAHDLVEHGYTGKVLIDIP